MSLSQIMRVSILGTGLLAGSAFSASPALAALPNCSVAALSGFGVPEVSIASATDVPATGSNPEYCSVQGTVTTQGEGAAQGAAEFILKLPVSWNSRFLFFGCGSSCGSLKDIAANPVDVAGALGRGYAVVNTDAGHEQDPATTDPTWTLLAPGVPNEPALIDFFYRAVHQVTVAAKALTQSYYAAKIAFAYFDGCSTGGRQSVMEGDRYPEDFDGLIAGDPIIDADVIRAADLKQVKAFIAPGAYLPFTLIPAIDSVVGAGCDAADGISDGLIQNPAVCAFDPHALVPSTLTAKQADAIDVYLKPVVDTQGRIVAPGMAVGYFATAGFEFETELSTPPANPTGAEPWGAIGQGPTAWTLTDGSIRYFIERNPTFDVNNDWTEKGDVIATSAVQLLEQRAHKADSSDPRKLGTFLRQGRKIILYHGFSDDQQSPYRSIWFYKELAKRAHGFTPLQSQARLFMVPGMGHCKNGPGPNSFDTLTAIDNWVTNGIAPDGIEAANSASSRTMPLCKFPEEASYLSGPVDVASSWTCDPRDERLLEVGYDGALAGANRDPAFSRAFGKP